MLEEIYEKGSVFRYPKVFQCDNGSKFKNNVIKFLEKHYVDVRRAAMKYKHTHSAFAETFKKELAKYKLGAEDFTTETILNRFFF